MAPFPLREAGKSTFVWPQYESDLILLYVGTEPKKWVDLTVKGMKQEKAEA